MHKSFDSSNRDIYAYPAWGLRISRAWKSNCVLGAVIPASQDDIKYLIGQNWILTPEAFTRPPPTLADIWS
jgi:hypothetical protein